MNRFFLAAVLVCSLVASSAFAADIKLGYIDVRKVLETSEAGKEAKEQLTARIKKYQNDINAKQEEVNKAKEDLEKQDKVMAPAVKAEKEKIYQQKLKDLQRFAKDAQDELQGKDEEYSRKIYEEMGRLIQAFGKSNGFTFIFSQNDPIIYADSTVDVTDEILKQFNASRKK